MPIEIKMPALSPTMEEGTLAKWLVKEGDTVKSGDVLAEIETDKATMEFESIDEGTVQKIVVPEGTDGVKVGEIIALIAGEGEDASTPAPAAAPAPKAAEPVQQANDGEGEAPAAQPQMPTAARALVADVADTHEDPEVPAGTELVRMTVRDALRDAMAEEMRKDDRVFVMGEEVAEYQGAYKVPRLRPPPLRLRRLPNLCSRPMTVRARPPRPSPRCRLQRALSSPTLPIRTRIPKFPPAPSSSA